MTDEQAHAILRESLAWISWTESSGEPWWTNGSIQLDGDFTADELRAILHFGPREGS